MTTLTLDAKPKKPDFAFSRRAERQYAVQLRKVARHVGEIIKGFDPAAPEFLVEINGALRRYAELLRPWARTVAARAIAEVSKRDKKTWSQLSKTMGAALREEVEQAPVGGLMRALLAEQVKYITSIPTDAAERVQRLAVEARTRAQRADEVAEEIMLSGHVSKGRADLIARTEIARTASALTMARSLHVGSEGYIWRTARDADVRPAHKRMEGRFVLWSEPPTLEDGTVTHAGAIYNCRCYPEPVLPDRFE